MMGPEPQKGFIHGAGAGLQFSVNPETIDRHEPVNYAMSLGPGAAGPHIQFGGGGERTLSFELTLDGIGTESGGVASQLASLEALTHKQAGGSPPRAALGIGARIWEGVVTELAIIEEKFNVRLEPVFVRVRVSFLRDMFGG